MPLPQPELAGESQGMFAGGVNEFVCGEWHGRGAEDSAGEVYEGNYEDQLQGVDDVICQL